jgi:glycerophosphoryl diester phosphodiesterase
MTIPRVIAHRGSSAVHADNSWAAFKAAVTEGADAIECDVQLTRDGALVLCHDLTLNGQPVRDLTAAAVEAAQPGTVELSDLLRWATVACIDVLVEIKEPEAALPAARMVGCSASHERVVVGGFHGPMLAAVKAAFPDVRTSFMIGSVLAADELVHVATAYRADGLHLCWEARASRPHVLVDPTLIAGMRRAGFAVTLWHEERHDELRALVELGPDAICTNTPALLRRMVDERRVSGPLGAVADGMPQR